MRPSVTIGIGLVKEGTGFSAKASSGSRGTVLLGLPRYIPAARLGNRKLARNVNWVRGERGGEGEGEGERKN